MLLGILSGYVAKWIKTWKVGKALMPVMPIMIIPIVSTCIVGMLYLYVLIGPIGAAMKWLVSMLSNMQGSSGIVLGLILGAMAAFDMGGPGKQNRHCLHPGADGRRDLWPERCLPYCMRDSAAWHRTLYLHFSA